MDPNERILTHAEGASTSASRCDQSRAQMEKLAILAPIRAQLLEADSPELRMQYFAALGVVRYQQQLAEKLAKSKRRCAAEEEKKKACLEKSLKLRKDRADFEMRYKRWREARARAQRRPLSPSAASAKPQSGNQVSSPDVRAGKEISAVPMAAVAAHGPASGPAPSRVPPPASEIGRAHV